MPFSLWFIPSITLSPAFMPPMPFAQLTLARNQLLTADWTYSATTSLCIVNISFHSIHQCISPSAFSVDHFLMLHII